ncbi:hypothetical protein H9P43_008792 [Blastocladiella emersonii ATCC 22665]|nr:hypothetical protein H9P43_008770 [Blastocladiella emersonii ATCC 22665]KAI9159452.1 hypothetical protein H9P43_008792 [Blastocladiella emersonii ATCC 22665]
MTSTTRTDYATVPPAMDADADTAVRKQDSAAFLEASAADDQAALDQLDGGFKAWSQVAVSFFVFYAVFGIVNSFGLFAAQYKTVEYPDASLSVISLIGTLTPVAMTVASPFSGRLAESWGFRNTLALGAVVSGVSLLLASFATQVWHLLLTQGVLYGVSCSLGLNPGLALVAQWWQKRRSTAIGISVAGSGVGGLVSVNLIQAIMPSVGVAWTLRVLAAINFALLAIAALLARPRLAAPSKSNGTGGAPAPPLLNLALFREKRFILLYIGLALNTFGFLVPPYLLPTYVAKATPHSPAFASALLTVFNITSILGRVSMGVIADCIGNVTSLALSILASGVSVLTTWMLGGTSQAWLYIFAGIYGFSSGGFLSITPSCVAQLFGVATLASTLGLMTTSNIPGYAAGTPIATALISESKGSLPSGQFAPAIGFAGATMILGGVFVVILRYMVLDRRVMIKM